MIAFDVGIRPDQCRFELPELHAVLDAVARMEMLSCSFLLHHPFLGVRYKASAVIAIQQTRGSRACLSPGSQQGCFSKRLGREQRQSGTMRNRKIKFVQYAGSAVLLGGALAVAVVSGEAQTDLPATAPQVREVLPSYEGQNVVSVEVAGRPDLDQRQLLPLLVQQEGQPFSQAKIDQSVSALKSRGVAKEVQVEIRPQANGIRVSC